MAEMSQCSLDHEAPGTLQKTFSDDCFRLIPFKMGAYPKFGQELQAGRDYVLEVEVLIVFQTNSCRNIPFLSVI